MRGFGNNDGRMQAWVGDLVAALAAGLQQNTDLQLVLAKLRRLANVDRSVRDAVQLRANYATRIRAQGISCRQSLRWIFHE